MAQDRTSPSISTFVPLSVALLSVSFAPIFIRFSETELAPAATVFSRLVVFLLCFGSTRLVASRSANPLAAPTIPHKLSSPSWSQWLLLASVGLVSIGSMLFWAISLQYTTVAKSILFDNLTPIFTGLGGWLVLGRRFDSKFWLGMAIAMTGTLALGIEDFNGAQGSLVGDLLATLSALCLGTYYLMAEHLRQWFSATTILLWRSSVAGTTLGIALLATGQQLFPTTSLALCGVIGLGLVCEGFGQRLLVESMDKIPSSTITLLLLLVPVVSATWAWIVFGEQISPMTWVGFAVILSGIYLSSFSNTPTTELSAEA